MHKRITTTKETSLCAVSCQQSSHWINIFIICSMIRRRTGHGNVRTAAWLVSGVTVITGARQTVKGKKASILTRCQSPRFYCRHCQATCSRLPGCIAPRRWYSWLVQQAVLAVLLSGSSVRQAARMSRPARHTIRRWWCWLKDRFSRYSFHLRSHFPELGRYASQTAFWLACFDRMSLADAMAWLDRDGVLIP